MKRLHRKPLPREGVLPKGPAQLLLFVDPSTLARAPWPPTAEAYYGNVDSIAARILDGGDSGRHSPGWNGPGLARGIPVFASRKGAA